MKTIVLLLAIAFAVVVKGDGESSSSESGEMQVQIQEIADRIKSKFNITGVNELMLFINSTQSKCPDVEDRIESVAREISICLKSIDATSETFCSLARKNFARCAAPVSKALVDCIPEESKDLPGMFVKIIASVVDQACNSTVEQILETRFIFIVSPFHRKIAGRGIDLLLTPFIEKTK
ncbi:hypothetical protein NQ317_013886 [Molorchus minor]|uniref:Secreted protein n=1 Tax=Molorchus minor TaxID=1323400 RepID=A0ABQ9K8Z0_9CUCU|nr:hypothetical protein NQ317_013886 [Molorchus minor]